MARPSRGQDGQSSILRKTSIDGTSKRAGGSRGMTDGIMLNGADIDPSGKVQLPALATAQGSRRYQNDYTRPETHEVNFSRLLPTAMSHSHAQL